MKALLVTYLWVTGIGAAIVLAVPSLVIIGAMLLVLPGIILGLLPSAFLYGLLFALLWFPLHAVIGDWPAAIAGALVTAGVMFAVPIAGNRITEARYRAERADDRLPASPLKLAGHIRIDRVTALNRKDVDSILAGRARDRGKPDKWALARLDRQCSDLCAALLFTDGVESVTVNTDPTAAPDTLAPDAATFRLVDRGQCATTLLPDGGNEPVFNGWPNAPNGLRALQDYWKLRLSTDRCIVREPARTAHDWRIVGSRLQVPMPATYASESKLPFVPRSVGVERLEIFDGAGQRLLRQTRARAKRITQPLLYLPSGDFSSFRFGWNTAEIGPRQLPDFQPIALLAAHAGLDVAVDTGVVAAGIRDQLAAVVADSARVVDTPTADMVPAFFDAMDKREVPPAEIDLAIRIIGDKRFGKFDNVYRLMAAMGDDAGRLRAPIVARLLAADPVADAPLKSLGEMLEQLPPGTFATLMPDDAALLADPERRTLATGLIKRQSDRGAAAGPLLVGILGEQLRLQAGDAKARERRDRIKHHEAIQAAIAALTRIGPAAADQLGAVEALVAQGVVHDGRRDSEDWQLMLMRLGKPVESIPEPKRRSIITKDFHGRLRSVLARYERDLEREQERRQSEAKARR